MFRVIKAVSKKILHPDNDAALGICCLCLEEADRNSFFADDDVVLDTDSERAVGGNVTDVLNFLIGENISETLLVFKTVCRKCTLAAFDAYNFIKNSTENAIILYKTVQKLEMSFNNVSEVQDCHSICVAVNPHDVKNNNVIKHYYDKKTISKDSAVARFEEIKILSEADTCYASKWQEDDTYSKYDYGKDDITIQFKDTNCLRTRYKNIVTDELLHNKSKPYEYKCKYCLQTLASKKYLREHFLRKHYQQSEELRRILLTKKCFECGELMKNEIQAIKEHELKHYGNYKCKLCNRKFIQLWFFNKHKKQKSCDSPTKGEFVCDYCGRKVYQKYLLARHIKLKHFGVKKNLCQWCGKNCHTPSELRLHILKHTKEKTAVCFRCGQSFVNSHSLNNHMKLHTGEKPYACEYCDQHFKNASMRKEHIRCKHLPPSEQCNICSKMFKTKASLYKHKKRHMIS